MKPMILYHTQQSSNTRREILEAAVDIASAEGLESLSIGRLSAEVGMSKTGLFSHFGSKEGLQLATVEFAKKIFVARVVQPSLAEARGVARLTAMLDSWLGYVEKIVFRGGCFFAAAAAEFDSRPGKVRKAIADLSQAWLTAIEGEIAFAKSRGEFDKRINEVQLAFELHAFVQEANWSFKLFGDKAAFRLARQAIQKRIDLAKNSKIKPRQSDGGDSVWKPKLENRRTF